MISLELYRCACFKRFPVARCIELGKKLMRIAQPFTLQLGITREQKTSFVLSLRNIML